MRFITLLQLLVALAFLSGCAAAIPVSSGPFPLQWNPDGSFCERKGDACLDLAPAKKGVTERNELQHALLGIATERCNKFKTQIFGRTSVGLFANLLSQFSSATATVISHDLTAKSMSALGTVTNAVSGDFEKRFAEQRLSLALSGIEVARTRIVKQILRETESDLSLYPVSRAINDVLRYHGVCSLQAGLNESARLVGAEYKEQMGQ